MKLFKFTLESIAKAREIFTFEEPDGYFQSNRIHTLLREKKITYTLPLFERIIIEASTIKEKWC